MTTTTRPGPDRWNPDDVLAIEEKPFSLFSGERSTEDPYVAVLRSTRISDTPLARAFFGRRNVDVLQCGLRGAIRERTGYSIDRQSEEELLVVMRYVYIQHGANLGGADEVRRLNRLVLREIVPQVGAALMQYVGYLRDASRVAAPLPRGVATSTKGTKTAPLPDRGLPGGPARPPPGLGPGGTGLFGVPPSVMTRAW